MPEKGHENFDLCIDRAGEGYRVRVVGGPGGEADALAVPAEPFRRDRLARRRLDPESGEAL